MDTATTSCYRGSRLNNRPHEFWPVAVPEHGTVEQCSAFILDHVWDCLGHHAPLIILRGEGQRAYCWECVQAQMARTARAQAIVYDGADFVIYDT